MPGVEQRTGRPLLRGWAAAVAAVVPAATAHGLADHHPVSVPAMLIAVVLAAAISVPLVGRAISTWRLAVTVLGGQGVLHGVFALAATLPGANVPGAAGATAAGAAHVHTARDAQAVAGVLHASVGDGLGGAALACTEPFLWMVVGHLAAAIITLVAYAVGLRALRQVLHRAMAAVDRVLRVATVSCPHFGRRVVLAIADAEANWVSLARAAARPRGPPRLAPR